MRAAFCTLMFFVLWSFAQNAHAAELTVPDTLVVSSDSSITRSESISADPKDTTGAAFRKEKLIAAVLAFPFPFGFTGLHRIYLGSEPWIPVAYLITGGGGLGLLPLIDFIFIVTANEEEFRSYTNNPNFFMWVE